jgi:hypothetical protein
MARYIDADIMEYDVLHLDIDVAEHKCKDYESYINGANQFRHQVKVALRHTPTADVQEVKRGKWKIKQDDYDCEYMKCSCCKEEFYPVDADTVDTTPNYCPNCGADMRGAKDE